MDAQPPSTPPVSLPGPAQSKRPLVTSAAWFVAWSALAAWLAFGLATSWPYEGSIRQLVLLLAVAGILFRGFDLARLRLSGRPVRGWRRAGARLAALVLAVPAGAALWPLLDSTSMGRFERAMAPLVAQLSAQASNPCPPAARYAFEPAMRDYLGTSHAIRPNAQVRHAGRRFVATFMGGSADFDGSTLAYDSAHPGWRKFHNDLRDQAAALEALTKDMAACEIPLQ